LRDAFPAFLAGLDGAPGGRPNLHLGVISPDMGSKGRLDPNPGPSVGVVGQGGCSGAGKAGLLQTNGAPIVATSGEPEPFLAVSRDGAQNITGTLEAAFNTITQVGASGCGFEQQLHAMRAALENTDENAGFLRANANLAVVMLTDEDDCSMLSPAMLGPESPTLGPLQSFRCFRFGVTCTEDTATVGAKTNCTPNAASTFVEDVAPFAEFLAGLKSHPNRVMFGAVMGAPLPVAVELRSINGQSQTAVAPTCDTTPIDGINGVKADPGVRLSAMADELAALGGQTHVDSICSRDLQPQVRGLGEKLATLVDNTCIPVALSAQADCIVEDSTDFQPAPDTVLPCTKTEAPGASCFRIADDASCSSGQRLEISRSTPPIGSRVSTLRCAQ
jgi:hypothetical protein